MFSYEDLSETQKRAVIDSVFSMRAPFVVFDGSRVVYANELWFQQGGNILKDLSSGLSMETTMYNEVRRVVGRAASEEQCLVVAREFNRAIIEGKEYEFRVSDGRLMKGHYNTIGNGFISGIEFDITELDMKRREAKRSKQLLKETLQGLPHGVILYESSGRLIYKNDSAQGIFSFLGIKLWDGLSHEELSEQLINTHSKSQVDEVGIIHKGSNDHFYLIEERELKVGFLVTAVDVTELRIALDEAKSAEIAKANFLANMSHEIRTPMNGLLGMAQVLELTQLKEDQRKCVEVIKLSSDALLSIINDILDFSKLEAAENELNEDAFNLSLLIREAIDIVRPLAASKDIEIIFAELQPSNSLLIGDGGKILQILLNLLSNAIKFTKTGHIKITSSAKSSPHNFCNLMLQVEDTGIGISEMDLERVFNSFEQSDNTTTREYGGTGLGLAIAQKLALLMGGVITVKSSLGRGAEFTLAINLKQSDELITSAPAPKRTFKGSAVLVIDDNQLNKSIIEEHLRPLQIKPYFVKSANHALECIKQATLKKIEIPLLICDAVMPGKTGMDFLKELRAGNHVPNTQVIILSSGNVLAQTDEFSILGVNHVLAKPCSQQSLLEAASSELSIYHTRTKPYNEEVLTASDVQAVCINEPVNNTGYKPYILVADDDEVNRCVFGAFLDRMGHQYLSVDNGQAAVNAYEHNQFDAILMDISMPVMDGLTASKKIREYEHLHNLSRIPILAVSAHASKEDKEQYYTADVDGYLSKPVKITDLEVELSSLLGIRELSSRSIKKRGNY